MIKNLRKMILDEKGAGKKDFTLVFSALPTDSRFELVKTASELSPNSVGAVQGVFQTHFQVTLTDAIECVTSQFKFGDKWVKSSTSIRCWKFTWQ